MLNKKQIDEIIKDVPILISEGFNQIVKDISDGMNLLVKKFNCIIGIHDWHIDSLIPPEYHCMICGKKENKSVKVSLIFERS